MPKGTPTYLTTDANGNVGATFSGHVAASGIDFVAGQDQRPALPTTAIQWHKTDLNGGVIAQISSVVSGGLTAAPTYITRIDTGDPNAGGFFSYLETKVNGGSHGVVTDGIRARVSGIGGDQTVKILDSNGASNFLQLAVAAKRQISFGQAFVSYPGGSRFYTPLNIAHGLGVVPVVVLASYVQNNDGYANPTNYDAVNFTAQGGTITGGTPGAGAVATLNWVAIG